jgi:hypothetical protein
VVWDFDFVVGVIGTIAGYLFDTVKVCLQTYRLYSSSLDYFIKIEKQESILGFYKGMSSPIFDVAIINGIFFSIKNLSKNFFYDPNTYFA